MFCKYSCICTDVLNWIDLVPQQISNTQRTENTTTDVLIQQQSHKLLMMEISMSETCWAHKKWNKITSDIKLVVYSSTTLILICDVLHSVRYSYK